MNSEEMWSFVHYLYGDELGLTSDDEDYVQPAYLSSLPELMVAVNAAAGGEEEEEDDEEHAHKEDHVDMVDNVIPVSSLALNRNEARRNDSISSSNGSGSEGRLEDDHSPLFIPLLPAGAQTFVDHHFHIPFDQLFLVLFSESTLLKVHPPSSAKSSSRFPFRLEKCPKCLKAKQRCTRKIMGFQPIFCGSDIARASASCHFTQRIVLTVILVVCGADARTFQGSLTGVALTAHLALVFGNVLISQ